jgi:hypothetical protein
LVKALNKLFTDEGTLPSISGGYVEVNEAFVQSVPGTLFQESGMTFIKSLYNQHLGGNESDLIQSQVKNLRDSLAENLAAPIIYNVVYGIFDAADSIGELISDLGEVIGAFEELLVGIDMFAADLLADIDPRGVGYGQFENEDNYPWIMSRADRDDGQVVDFVGHSLGGALCQWFAAELTSLGTPIGGVYTYNAPGISGEYALQKFDRNMAGNVLHSLVEGDKVGYAGNAHIEGSVDLYSVLSPEISTLAKHGIPLQMKQVNRTGDERPTVDSGFHVARKTHTELQQFRYDKVHSWIESGVDAVDSMTWFTVYGIVNNLSQILFDTESLTYLIFANLVGMTNYAPLEPGAPLRLDADGVAPAGSADLANKDDVALIIEFVQQQLFESTTEYTLDDININIADLPGDLLGQASGNTITLDVDGAGYGWFIDATPWESSEFDANGAAIDDRAAGRVDLLSVILHELGHVYGLEHSNDPDDLMYETLPIGVRRTSAAELVDKVFEGEREDDVDSEESLLQVLAEDTR